MEITFDILGLNTAQAIFDQSELLLRIVLACILGIMIGRSEEHTSELQSLA